MVSMDVFNSRDEWLKNRTSMIGGSDAASILGMNPWMSNVDLWEIKSGIKKQPDISDKDVVKYGNDAESHLRALFAIDYPKYKVSYIENNMWRNDKYPFAHASLDGWLEDNNGRKGILEIKTTNIMRSGQSDKWKDQIPQNYFVQVLHYLMVTEFDFVVLKAQLKFGFGDDIYLQTKHYEIERSDVEGDIEYLIEAEKKFADSVKNGIKPSLILPDL